MADAFSLVQPTVEMVLGFASSLVKEAIVSVHGLKKDIGNLSERFSEIQRLLKDAEKKQTNDEKLRDWLDKVKDVSYDAVDVLDLIVTQVSLCRRNQAVDFWSPVRKFSFKYKIARDVKEIVRKLNDVCERNNFNLVQSIDGSANVVCTTSFLLKSEEDFRKNEKEQVLSLLRSDDYSREGQVYVISITGMGGIGKTTLAKLVFNDESIEKDFEFKVWVCVTENFNLDRIVDSLVQHVPGRRYDNPKTEIKTFLKDKRFLVILDDVWTENKDDWEQLETIFREGKSGSRVVVTSRTSKAFGIQHENSRFTFSRQYPLSELKDEESWLLFCNTFPRDMSSVEKNNSNIARRIVGKCKGLPLAIKAMARLLSDVQVNDWEEGILKNDIWEVEEEKSKETSEPIILPALKLSFDHLPSHLKQCFAYCSTFPKAYEFDKNELVKLWMAEGFLQMNEIPGIERPRIETGEGKGVRFFDQLVARSFIQEELVIRPHQEISCSNPFILDRIRNADKGEYLDPTTIYKMHDLIHELALSVSRSYCGQVRDIVNDPSRLTEKTRHVSLFCENVEKPAAIILDKCRKLRTLLLPSRDISSDFGPMLDRMFHTLTFLRVLDLSSTALFKLPKSIKKLKLLRYLDLSKTNIKKLPNSICSLYNLQTLKLLGCIWFLELPKDFGNLIHLRHLELDDVFWYKCSRLPQRMGSITNLYNLHAFLVGRQEGYRVEELKNMMYITGTLRILKLENAVNAGLHLKNKERLRKLVFEWSNRSDVQPQDHEADETVLHAMEPHSNLEELKICHYEGNQFPTWMRLLQNLKVLTLHHCTSCKVLILGQLPQLGEIYIKGMQDLEEWCDELFLSVTIVKISSCPKLRKLPQFFPEVEVLKIKKCDLLKALPVTPTLRLLVLVENPLLEGWNELGSEAEIGEMKQWPKKVYHMLHKEHQLVLSLRPNYKCDGCGTGGHHWSFCCEECNFDLHPKCASVENRGSMPMVFISEDDATENDDDQLMPCTSGDYEVQVMLHTSAEDQHQILQNKSENDQDQPAVPSITEDNQEQLVPSSSDYSDLSMFLEAMKELFSHSMKLTTENDDDQLMPCTSGDYEDQVMLHTSAEDQHQILQNKSENDQDQPAVPSITEDNQEQPVPSSSNNSDRFMMFLEAMKELFSHSMKLTIIDCPRLQVLPPFPVHKLMISGCESLHALPPPKKAKHLLQLELGACHNDDLVRAIPHAPELYSLVISNISNLISLPRLPKLPSLLHLHIRGCKDLESLFQEDGCWQSMPNLTTLSIRNCPKLLTLPEEGLPTTLECLVIGACPKLSSLGPQWVLKNLTSLKDVKIEDCEALESLPTEELSASIQHLCIRGCSSLTKRCGSKEDGGPDWSKIRHIPDLEIESSSPSSTFASSSACWCQHFTLCRGISNRERIAEQRPPRSPLNKGKQSQCS